MKQALESFRASLLSEDSSLETLENILAFLNTTPQACKPLWESDELIFVLLQHFTDSFYTLNTELFNREETHKIKLCIDILTAIVHNLEIDDFFFRMQLDYYIYPFLMSAGDEVIKISVLNLFSALLKDGIHENMRISELLPLLLKIMDASGEDCQVLALKTLDRILTGTGLDYAVQTLDRFRAIDVVLGSQVKKAIFSKNTLLLKYLLRIYTKICNRSNVKMKVKEKLPEGLDSKEMYALCEEDDELRVILKKFVGLLDQ